MEYRMTPQEIQNAIKNGTLTTKTTKPAITIGNKNKMKFINYKNFPAKQFVIERLGMSPGNLTLLCATGCSGKTMLAQYIALCIDSGSLLFGKFPVQKGSVVHIDQEMTEEQAQRRYVRIAGGLEIDNIDIERTDLIHRLDEPSLNAIEVEQELIDLCTGKVLCIIDSLKAASCADENSAQIEIILKMFKRIAAKTKCAIMVIHHKGKGKDSKQSGRGHSSIYDSCDVQFDLDVENGIYSVKCAKNRDGKYFAGLQYQLLDQGEYIEKQKSTDKLVFDLLAEDVQSIILDQRQKITIALMEIGQLKYNDLFQKVKGDRAKFANILDAMISANELIEEIGPRNSKLYSLTEQYKKDQIK